MADTGRAIAFTDAVLAVWLNHKGAFRHIRWIDWGLHWANMAILFTTALLPFATAVIAEAMQRGDWRDEITAVGLYALVGMVMCTSWLWFFEYLARHPELAASDADARFFRREPKRALIGVVLYAVAGVLGYFVGATIALALFALLAVFYAVTSEGLESPKASPKRS